MQCARPDRLDRAVGYADLVAAGEKPAAVLECVADAIVITDTQLDLPGPTITFVNAAFETLSGYQRFELVGRSPRLMQGFGTDLSELADMKAALLIGECFTGSVVNYDKSGMEYVIGWAIAPIIVDGAVRQWLSVQSDVMADVRVSRTAN